MDRGTIWLLKYCLVQLTFQVSKYKASRLLLTSRNQDMGAYCQFVHNMKVLDTNQSWELFMKKAFIHNTEGKCPEEVQNIGDEMLKWCGGLPFGNQRGRRRIPRKNGRKL